MRQAGQRLAALVPAPRGVVAGGPPVRLDRTLRTAIDAPDRVAVIDALRLLPLDVCLTDSEHRDAQLVLTVADGPGTGAYRLAAGEGRVSVEADGTAGLVNAVHTLRQLLPVAAYRAVPPADEVWDVAGCVITDAPRFRWRGALIDVARHFLPKHELLRHLDVLAAHKINIVQLHLTDDQGWRVESAAFPRLHEVGSWRRQTQINHVDDAPVFDGTPHGGYYTREDLREIGAFATRRGITLVPEIELPGHTGALLAAYPELGSPRVAHRDVPTAFGIHDTLLDPGPQTLAFLTTLLNEVMDLFPGPWLHVGADESLLDAWGTDPAVRTDACRRGLNTPQQIFAAFLTDLERIAAARRRTLVTWDDGFATPAVAAPADTSAQQVVTAWRGTAVARRAAAAGHDVILAPVIPTYFDYAHSDDPREPFANGASISVDDVLAWQPVPEDWNATERDRVLGVQCQLWTEYVPHPRQVDYMLYPRASAFADVAWSGGGTDPGQRRRALAEHLHRLDAAGIEYRPLDGPHPWQEGGTGQRGHRASTPVTQIAEHLDTAAATGQVAHAPPTQGRPRRR